LVRRYSKQLLEALVYLHQNKIIHKDIKCANVLVDHEGTVKLSDFGCAKQLDTSASLVANGCGYLKGSVLWMSPERIRESAYGYKSDVWSFGCTVLEMATGKPPWMQYSFDNELAAIWKISQANEQPFVPDSLSAELQELIRACLRLEPGERPSAASLLKHKFFQL
jgi:serine/threonine protein kinase